jgi:protein phosphatase
MKRWKCEYIPAGDFMATQTALGDTVNWQTSPIPVRLNVDAFGLTDTGKVRSRNEDQFLVARLLKGLEIQQTSLPEPRLRCAHDQSYLFVVADGMGGHAGGDAASTMAVDAVEHFVLETLKWFLQLEGRESDELLAAFRKGVGEAHERILAAAAENPELRGMATTLTLALSLNDSVSIAHAGDSRCYLFRNDSLHQLTEDHTLVGELARQGQIPKQMAATHPMRHLVTNAVGNRSRDLTVDVQRIEINDGDVLLLCTDGLTEMVSPQEMADVLRSMADVESGCRELLARANSAGGRDNITVVLAKYRAAE